MSEAVIIVPATQEFRDWVVASAGRIGIPQFVEQAIVEYAALRGCPEAPPRTKHARRQAEKRVASSA